MQTFIDTLVETKDIPQSVARVQQVIDKCLEELYKNQVQPTTT